MPNDDHPDQPDSAFNPDEPIDLAETQRAERYNYHLTELQAKTHAVQGALGIAKGAVEDLLTLPKSTLKTVAEVDATTRANVETSLVFAKTVTEMAELVKARLKELERPTVPQKSNAEIGADLLKSIFETAKDGVVGVMTHRPQLLEQAMEKAADIVGRVQGLASPPQAPAPAAREPVPGPSADPARGAESSAPNIDAFVSSLGQSLPGLGVVFDMIPPELQHLSLEDMRRAIFKAANAQDPEQPR